MLKKFLITLAAITSLAAASAQQIEVHQEEKPAIAFDIHGVLTNVNVWKMAKTIFWGLLKEPGMIFKMTPHVFKSGEYAQYPLLRAIYNCHTPNQKVWELVRQLKKEGYPLYIFSNINDDSFTEFSEQFPDYFALFADNCHIVQNNNPLLRKPAPTAYTSCAALIAQKYPERPIIFIDNKKSNITAAQTAGITGIVFSSAQQLKHDLAQHHVMI